MCNMAVDEFSFSLVKRLFMLDTALVIELKVLKKILEYDYGFFSSCFQSWVFVSYLLCMRCLALIRQGIFFQQGDFEYSQLPYCVMWLMQKLLGRPYFPLVQRQEFSRRGIQIFQENSMVGRTADMKFCRVLFQGKFHISLASFPSGSDIIKAA